MFQTSKSLASAKHLRLPKQMALPTDGDIEFVREQANKVIGRLIELPFSLSQDKENDFVLNVLYAAADNEPVWSLSQIKAQGETKLWQHITVDTFLISNLIKDAIETIKSNANQAAINKLNKPDVAQEVTQKFSTGIAAILDAAMADDRALAEGNLKITPVPVLLKTINHQKLTGKLALQDKKDTGEVYFNEGIVIHCLLKDIGGDLAIEELMTWKEGDYRFYSGQKTLANTVTLPFDQLLAAGLALLEQFSYLEANGFHLESCLIRKNAMMSEQELRIRLSKGVPADLEQQIDFYELVDNHSTIFELLAKRPIAKAQWIPIIFNLVSSGLVQISGQASQQSRLASLKSFGIDEGELQNTAKHLIRAETGILTYPAFIYFLDQEYLRYQYFNFPFSVIVFSLSMKKGDLKPLENLPTLAIRRAMQRMSQVKRPVDMLGHFEQHDFAMILPNSNASAAGALANHLVDVLGEAPLTSDIDTKSLSVAFGVATVPEDCQEMDKLLLAAKKACEKAKTSRERVVLARGVIEENKP